MDTQIIITIISSLGIGTIIGGLVNFYLGKNKELLFTQIEQRKKRYTVMLLFMRAIISDRISELSRHGATIKSKDDALKTIIDEFHDMILYGGRDVIISVRKFIEHPDERNFQKALIEMREDLWNKDSKLSCSDIGLNLQTK